jgi:hypothetical protein
MKEKISNYFEFLLSENKTKLPLTALRAMIRGYETLGLNKVYKKSKPLDVIGCYSNFPKIFLRETEPKNDTQREMVYVCEEQYKGSAKWLRWLISSRNELLIDLDIGYKPFGELSKHRHELCQQLWLSLPFAQSVANDPNILWLICEMSECIHALKANGFWGEPLVNSQGKIFGKREIYKIKSSGLTKLIGSIKNDGCLPEDSRRPIPSDDYFAEQFTDVLCLTATVQALKLGDSNLQNVLTTWLSHERNYERLLKGLESYQVPTIRGDDLHWTGKDKKTYKPKPAKKGIRDTPTKGSK